MTDRRQTRRRKGGRPPIPPVRSDQKVLNSIVSGIRWPAPSKVLGIPEGKLNPTLERMDDLARDKHLALRLCGDALALIERLMSGRPWTSSERAERARIEEGIRAIRQE